MTWAVAFAAVPGRNTQDNHMSSNQTRRRLQFEIFRYNPEDPNSEPHTDNFEIEETEFMTLYIALNNIREEHDPGLQFDFACRSAICGSCAMIINETITLKDVPKTAVCMNLKAVITFRLNGQEVNKL